MGKSWMPCRWPAADENCVAGVCEPVVEEENELELSTSADQPVFPGSLVAAVATTRRPAAGELMVFSGGPSLPAEASGTTPANCKLPAAMALAEFGSPDDEPKLMFTTVARGFGNPATSRSWAASCRANWI